MFFWGEEVWAEGSVEVWKSNRNIDISINKRKRLSKKIVEEG
jgi:hypothetical protein